MDILKGIKGLLRSEMSNKIHRWSYVFLDCLKQHRGETHLFVTYVEGQHSDGTKFAQRHLNYDPSDGFDSSIDIFFWFENGRKNIELVDFRYTREMTLFRTYRLYPLLKRAAPVYWMYQVPSYTSGLPSGTEITDSINKVFNGFVDFKLPSIHGGDVIGWTLGTPPFPSEIQTPLGVADLYVLPETI